MHIAEDFTFPTPPPAPAFPPLPNFPVFKTTAYQRAEAPPQPGTSPAGPGQQQNGQPVQQQQQNARDRMQQLQWQEFQEQEPAASQAAPPVPASNQQAPAQDQVVLQAASAQTHVPLISGQPQPAGTIATTQETAEPAAEPSTSAMPSQPSSSAPAANDGTEGSALEIVAAQRLLERDADDEDATSEVFEQQLDRELELMQRQLGIPPPQHAPGLAVESSMTSSVSVPSFVGDLELQRNLDLFKAYLPQAAPAQGSVAAAADAAAVSNWASNLVSMQDQGLLQVPAPSISSGAVSPRPSGAQSTASPAQQSNATSQTPDSFQLSTTSNDSPYLSSAQTTSPGITTPGLTTPSSAVALLDDNLLLYGADLDETLSTISDLSFSSIEELVTKGEGPVISNRA